jgi:lysophospholipase L1-like esterase
MKKLALSIVLIFGFLSAIYGQQKQYTPIYHHRVSLFDQLPVNKKDIVFLGNSITHFCEWSELFNNKHIKNRGISGDNAQGVYERLDQIVKGKPEKIFLMIGINDLSQNLTVDSVFRNITRVVDEIKKKSPRTKLYIQSVLPINNDFPNYPKLAGKEQDVIKLNILLKNMCSEKGIRFIDIYSHLRTPGSEKLDPKYTRDGLHLSGEGYLVWRDILKGYL